MSKIHKNLTVHIYLNLFQPVAPLLNQLSLPGHRLLGEDGVGELLERTGDVRHVLDYSAHRSLQNNFLLIKFGGKTLKIFIDFSSLSQ